MAILHVYRGPVTGSRSGERGDTRRYNVQWRVVTDDADDGPQTVMDAVDPSTAEAIPDIGDAYAIGNDADSTCFCRKITPTQTADDGCHWDVDVEFSSEAEAIEDPLARPIDIEWSSERFTEPLERDLSIDELPIRTTAGEPLNPLPEVERNRPILTVTKNQVAFSTLWQTTYENAVNTDPFQGFGPRQAKVDAIRARIVRENGVTYWQVQYVFKFKRDGWRLELLNAGLYVKSGTDFVQLTDKGDQPLTKPVAINEAGSAKVDPGGTPHYLTFQGYTEVSFAPFEALFI